MSEQRNMNATHDKHRKRMTERFFKDGFDSLAQHEQLEFLLYSAIPRGDTNELAHRLLNAFGSLSSVLETPYDELIKIDGVGPKAAMLLIKIAPMARAYFIDSNETSKTIGSVEEAWQHFRFRYIGLTNEHLYVMFLNDKKRILKLEEVAEGETNRVEMPISKIIKLTVACQATGIILSHNHPNGIPLFSKNDITSSMKLKSALEIINVALLDHILICGDEYCSMAESGHIDLPFPPIRFSPRGPMVRIPAK